MGKLIIKNKYGTIPNDLLNSANISFKAKGLYAYIQSKPDNWEFSAERISKQVKEGLPTVVSALKELEIFGYLVRKRFQNNRGFWVVDYILYENPSEENLHIGNPIEENPNVGKITNNSNKDFSKKEYNNITNNKKNIEKRPLQGRDLIWDKWFKFKAEKNQSYKSIGKKSLLEKYELKSDNELKEIIEQSIVNNWSGLFELKKENTNGNSNNEPKLGTSAARMEALRNW